MLSPLVQYWEHKGHTFGQSHSKVDLDLMYVNIPKNASTWTKDILSSLGWEIYNYHLDKNYTKQAMVVLRDPIDRWLTGIAEYLTLYHPSVNVDALTPFSLDLIFDRVSFDDHTEQQIYFIDRLDLNNCVFFKCDNSYRQNFTNFLSSNGITGDWTTKEYQYSINENFRKVELKNFFEKQISQHPRYLNQLKNHFKNDYLLIESVKFYGS